MRMAFPLPDEPLDPVWSRPLNKAAVAVAKLGDWADQFFDPDDFMIMGRLVRQGRPDIVLYKHVETRLYLNLDDAANAYRFCPPKDPMRGDGRYVRQPDLRAAIDHLRLCESARIQATSDELTATRRSRAHRVARAR